MDLCIKCAGPMEASQIVLPWRGTVIYLPFACCTARCLAFIELLDTNEQAVKFLKEGLDRAQLACSKPVGNA
jgi:hypothetical protein